MDPAGHFKQLKNQMEEIGADIELLSTPIFEQQPMVEKLQVSIHFVSGNPQYDYVVYRDFKLRIQQAFGDQVTLSPFLVGNIDIAYEFVEQIQHLLPGSAQVDFSADKIKEKDFSKHEPIYVVLAQRQILSYR